MTKKQLFINTLSWGFILWLIGYVIGIVLFMVVAPDLIGWIITPIGVVITLWVLFKKINREKFQCYVGLAVIWTLMAVILDYLFIVKALKPADGYYKPDVYLYYALTFLLPLLVGWRKFYGR
jgi:hypothetical protein